MPADIGDGSVTRHGAVTTHTHSTVLPTLTQTRRASWETDGRARGGAVDVDAIDTGTLLSIGWRPIGHGGDLVDEREAARVEDAEQARRERTRDDNRQHVLALLSDDTNQLFTALRG